MTVEQTFTYIAVNVSAKICPDFSDSGCFKAFRIMNQTQAWPPRKAVFPVSTYFSIL